MPGSAEVVLEAREVSKIYRMGEVEVRALDGASLALRRGEITRRVGPDLLN